MSLLVAAGLLAGACDGADTTTTGTASPPATTAGELPALPPVTGPPQSTPPPAGTPGATTAPPAPATTTSTTAAPPPTTTTTLAPSPLNGLGVADERLLDRRVMAVKIDNHREARPQSGLQEAEAVYELLVEGGLSRFIALFHTADSAYVGPIRSIRPTDPTLLKPLGAPMQISGGQAWVLSYVRRQEVDYMVEVAGGGTFRIDSRPGPHNLYGDTAGMRERADRLGYPDDAPPPLFAFGAPTPSQAPAARITLSWSAGNDVVWQYDGASYLRFQGSSPHLWVDREGAEGQVAFDTLVVLVADRYTARPRAGESGSSVPALDTVGSGAAWVFYDGVVVSAEWARDRIEEPFALTGGDGTPIVVPPGRLWISVFPSNRDITWSAGP